MEEIAMKIRRLLILLMRMLNPDPLSKITKDLPKIDVLIPVAAKDLFLLESVIQHLHLNCRNPIQNIFVVTPEKKYVNSDSRISLTVFNDADFLDIDLVKFKLEHPDVYGWCVQQLIKIKAVHFTKERYLLWLDSDTLLNAKRTFVDNEYILEIISDEYHRPYFRGLQKTLNLKAKFLRLSRVSHHAVVDVKTFQLFEAQNNIKSEFDWKEIILNSVNEKEKNSTRAWYIFGNESFSEYEMNSLILKKFNTNRKLAYWWNESRSTYSNNLNYIEVESGLLEKFSEWKRPEKPYSISFHSWRTQTK